MESVVIASPRDSLFGFPSNSQWPVLAESVPAPERGARMARREERADREFVSDEQRRQPGPARAAVVIQRGQTAGSPRSGRYATKRAPIGAARAFVRHERLVGFDRQHPIRGRQRGGRHLHGQLESRATVAPSPAPDCRRGWSHAAACRNTGAATRRRSSA